MLLPIRRCILVPLPPADAQTVLERLWQEKVARPPDATWEVRAGNGKYCAIFIRTAEVIGVGADAYLAGSFSEELKDPVYFIESFDPQFPYGPTDVFVRGMLRQRPSKKKPKELLDELGIDIPPR